MVLETVLRARNVLHWVVSWRLQHGNADVPICAAEDPPGDGDDDDDEGDGCSQQHCNYSAVCSLSVHKKYTQNLF
jgi:hypothetical protein